MTALQAIGGSWLAACVAVGLAMRLACWHFLAQAPMLNRFSDMEYYAGLGDQIYRGEPLSAYDESIACLAVPKLCATMRHAGLDPVRTFPWLNIGADLITSVLIGLIGVQLLGRALGRGALLAAAVYVPFACQCCFLLTETLFMFLLVAGYYFYLRGWRGSAAHFLGGVLSGTAFALAAEFKENVWLLAVLLPIASAWYGLLRRQRWLFAGLAGAVLAIGLASGQKSAAPAEDPARRAVASIALELLHGRTYAKYVVGMDREGGRWVHSTPPALYYKAKNEPIILNHDILDGFFLLRTTWDFLREHPMTWLTYSVEHVLDLYGAAPYWPLAEIQPRLERWLRAGVCLFLLLPALMGLAAPLPARLASRDGGGPAAPSSGARDRIPAFAKGMLVLPLLGITLVAFVFYGAPRYRLPYDGCLILLSLLGYEWIWTRGRRPVKGGKNCCTEP
ncbi:MAG TPA: hypothetical protein P5555_04460 [Candidatus Paceibacterota bacterium]|nr:hypothetical protein [Verrucomicrobiota bacterium]HOX01453.1 hypothetical protein [Verrucomicrobiota bacterium]HRZ44424.1 hypothetical protein [Candidatus Paceibacterota bacterium]